MIPVVVDGSHTSAETRRRERRAAIGQGALAALALTLAHGWTAGWTSNQNTYFVHAVADSVAPLRRDLLARTADATPVFTALMTPLVRVFDGPHGVDLLWPLVAFSYFGALCWVAGDRVWRRPPVLLLWTAVLALLVTPQTGWVADLADTLGLRPDQPRQVISGLAGQFALGSYVQPSMAAAGAVVGSVWFVRRREPILGLGLVMAAAVVHPSFMVPALMVAVSLLAADALTVDDRRAAGRTLLTGSVTTGVVATLAVALNHDAITALRGPGASRATSILVHERIPHHALVGQWFGTGALVTIGIVAAAAALAARSAHAVDRRLGLFLAIVLGMVVLGMAMAAILGSDQLDLTFPWRASVVAAPLATSWLVGRAAAALVSRIRRPLRLALSGVAGVLLVVVVVHGIQSTTDSFDHRPADGALITALRAASPSGTGLVPTNLQSVRLNAEVPVYADWKSHPVEPSAVIEWRRRIDRIDAAMEDPDALCGLVDRTRAGWVVLRAPLARDAQTSCLGSWRATDVGDDTVLLVRG